MIDRTNTKLGSYHITDKLGQGGMATVYKAFQPNMSRVVAIKVLPSVLKLDSSFVQRFEQEAKIVASLEHARILPVYDYGEEDDTPYLVMRYLEGGTLHQRIEADGPLTPAEASRIISQVAEGLAYAHSKGVIHRDMSSNNIMLDAVGDASITDFGLAKIMAASSQMTGGSIVGTPAYVSPEQALGEKPDVRTDVYALGIDLYEMLIGDVPFHGDSAMSIMLQHVNSPLPDPQEMRPDLSDGVVAVILRATAKDPEHRYTSAIEMAKALEAAVSGKPLPVRTAVIAPAKPQKIASARGGLPGWLIPALLGVIAVGLAAVLVILLTRTFSTAGTLTPAASATQVIAQAPSVQARATFPPPRPTSVVATEVPAVVAPLPSLPSLPSPPASEVPQPMTGLEKLPCPPFEEARLSVDFTADRPGDLNIFRLIGDAEAPTLDGDWLEIPPADPMNSLDVPLNPGLEAPHVLVQAAWRAGPGAVVLFVGAPPAAPYGFFVGGPSGLVIRSGPSMLASAPELLGDTQDGETHIIEFWVSNGLLRGLIDGEIVVQAEDTSLQPPYVVLLHTEGFSVSINALTICDRASG